MKQSKLRRRRVIRYSILFFIMVIVLIGMVVGPAVIGDKILPAVKPTLDKLKSFRLLQPNDLNNNNTNGTSQTGTGRPGYTGPGAPDHSAAASSSSDSSNIFTNKVRLI